MIKSFKDFNIKPQYNAFTGEKIGVDKLLNVEITIHDFKIGDSIKKIGTKMLTIQIEYKGERRVVFTGATILQQLIQQVPKHEFPFKTTIVKQGEHLEFS